VRNSPQPKAESDAALARWQAAVELSNVFLASPWRRTLPVGKFLLSDEGMIFQSDAGEWPVHVRVTMVGDLCARFGFSAQERSDGFVVGRTLPRRDAVMDNTFFRHTDGKFASPQTIAGLLLHELTHSVFREGTVGFWPGFAYYAEAAVTWRYRTLSGERRAFATSEEFHNFAVGRGKPGAAQAEMLRRFELHLAEGPTKYCRHGLTELPPAPQPTRQP